MNHLIKTITSPAFVHPELQNGEVFFTNSSAAGFEMILWDSKRKGEQAFDSEGNLLSEKDWFPVFIQTKELERSETTIRDARSRFRSSMNVLYKSGQ